MAATTIKRCGVKIAFAVYGIVKIYKEPISRASVNAKESNDVKAYDITGMVLLILFLSCYRDC